MSSRHNVPYFFREGFRGIFKHGFMSFASVVVITICLVLCGTTLILMLTLENTITDMGNTGDICVYVDETLSDDSAAALESDFRSIEGISELQFIDRAQALEDLREKLGEDSAVLEGLENDNPLRNYYRIWVDNIDTYVQTVDALKNTEGVAEVYASMDTMQTLIHVRYIVGMLCLFLIVLFGLVSIFLISNTLKLTTFDRQAEIGIMKMIGATNAFIHMPFFIESFFLSLFSAALSFGLQWVIGTSLMASPLASLSFVRILDFRQYFLYFALADLGISLLLGIVGSLLPLRKYMRV